MKCRNCDTENSFAAGLIVLIGTPLLFNFFIDLIYRYSLVVISGAVLVRVVAYMIIVKQDRQRVSAFNTVKLKGK